MTGTISNPGERRTFSRRKMQAKWRRSPRWKKMLAEHAHVPGVKCAHCGMEHGQQRYDRHGNPLIDKNSRPVKVVLTINHLDRGLYLTEDLYLTWNPQRMEICCTACNREFERGRKPCPKCLKAGYVRYIKWYDLECQTCYFLEHPEDLKKAEGDREKFKAGIRAHNADRAARRKADRHPCRRHLKGQGCKKGGACEFSPAKAPLKCKRGFLMKVVRKVAA